MGRYEHVSLDEEYEAQQFEPIQLISQEDLDQFFLTFRRNNDPTLVDEGRELVEADTLAWGSTQEVRKGAPVFFWYQSW